MDIVTHGVLTVDTERRITFFNEAAAAITGIRPHEAIGRKCDEILRADSCETDCLLAHAMTSGRPVRNVPTTITHGDGNRVSVGMDISLLKDGSGQVVGGLQRFHALGAVPGRFERMG